MILFIVFIVLFQRDPILAFSVLGVFFSIYILYKWRKSRKSGGKGGFSLRKGAGTSDQGNGLLTMILLFNMMNNSNSRQAEAQLIKEELLKEEARKADIDRIKNDILQLFDGD